MKLAVKTIDNKDAGEITLDKEIFGLEVRVDILNQMVKYQRNKRRQGTHQAKTRGEVIGTGAKPWAQKGTGRARAGDLKRPQDIGGGVAHGPRSRSHATDLPKKIRKLALKTALSAKAASGKLVILDKAEAKDHKTKQMAKALEKFGITSAVIVTGVETDVNFARATRNLPRIDVLTTAGANVYDILRRDTLVLTKDAVNALTEKLKG
jgi:large subunit ribosomal protein L4